MEFNSLMAVSNLDILGNFNFYYRSFQTKIKLKYFYLPQPKFD